MSKKKNNVNTSWSGKYANAGYNQQFLNEIADYDQDIQKEISDSEYRTARLQYDIDQTKADIKALNEDPEGYFYEKEQRELEKNPKTLGNYLKNWYNSHCRRMNDFQIQDFQGYLDRSDLWGRLADSLKEYWDIEDRVNQINDEIKYLRMRTTTDELSMRDIDQLITDLLVEQNQLVKRHQQLEPDVEAFKSYIPGGIRSRYYDLVAGDGEKGLLSNNFIFGRTSQAHDEMGDILRFTSSMFAKNRTRAELRQMLDRALQERDKKQAEWKKALDANIADRDRYEKVDRWFKEREGRSGTDIFDADTWLYGMPGLIAGSTSGMSKILPAMLTGALTASAIAATGGAAAVAAGVVGGISTLLLNYGAGVGENNAEVAMAYNERLEDYLKNEDGKNGSLYKDIVEEGRKKLHYPEHLSDEQIFEQYRKGLYTINNTAANKKMRELAVGIESQFQDDMAATTWSSFIETPLQILPLGKIISVPKALRYQMLKTAKRRLFLRGGLSTLAEGYEVGSIASPIGGVLYAPIHLAVSPTVKKVGRAGKLVLDEISTAAHISEAIPEKVLTRKFLKEPRTKYFKDLTGRWAISSAAEGVEEGKQYISSERYKNGYYTDAKIKSVSETLLDDFLAGSKSAALLLGMPVEDLLSEKDRRILQEIKGGFLLGGLQTSIVNVALSISPYRAEQKATTAIVNSMLLDKASKVDNLKKALIYAEASKSASSYLHIVNAFDKLRKMNENEKASTGEYGIDPEVINEEQKRFAQVAKMANDSYTVKQAKSQDIEPGTKEYNQFVAVKQIAEDEVRSYEEIKNQAHDNFMTTLAEITEAIFSNALDNVALVGELNSEKESNVIAEHTSAENYNQMQNVAKYAALLRRREELDLGITNAEIGKHREIKKILKEQLEDTNNLIANLKKVIESYTNEDESIDIDNLESVETNLVLNKEDHDKLTDVYRQLLVADHDLDLAIQQYERVVGKAHLNGKPIEDGQNVNWGDEFDNVTFVGGNAKSVIRDIKTTINDDNDLSSSIDEDFENRTDDDGNEVISEQQEDEINSTPIVQNDPVKEFVEDGRKPVEEIEKSTETPQETKPVEQLQVKPAENKSVEAVLRPAEPVSTILPTTTPEMLKSATELRKITKNQSPSTPIRIVINNLFDGVDKSGVEINKRIKESFSNANKESIISKLESVEGSDLNDQIERIFSEEGLEKYWANRDAFENFGVGGHDIANAVRLYIKENRAEQADQITKNQQLTLDNIKKKAEESSKYVKEVTSDHYIIDVEGTPVKMRRVHTIMPEYWVKSEDGNDFMAALQVGNVFDNLARIFLGDFENLREFETNRDALIERLWNEKASHKDNPNDPSLNDISKMLFKDVYSSREQFELTIENLYNIGVQYNKLGWVLSTDSIVWYSKLKDGYVAGETDMLAVDKNGDIHIIDFKTAKARKDGNSPFAHYLVNYSFSIGELLENELLSLREEDFHSGARNNGLSKAARLFIKKVRMRGIDKTMPYEQRRKKAESNRNIVVVWDEVLKRAVLKYILSDYTTYSGTFRKSHLYKNATKISKQDEYSDLLTAYKNLVSRSLANVVDLEVLGFEVTYDHDGTNLQVIHKITNPVRVKVSDSQEMQDTFNAEGDAPTVEQETPAQVEAQENKESEESVQKSESKNVTKVVPKDPAPQVVSPTVSLISSIEGSLGHSNLNPAVLNRDYPDLEQAIIFDPDFVNEAVKNGSVVLYTETIDDRRGKGVPSLYADVTYKGKTYKRIYIYSDPNLLKEVLNIEKNKVEGLKIVATSISRTAGEIKTGELKSIAESGLLDKNVDNLQFTADGGFGIVKGNDLVAFVGNDASKRDIILTFTKNNKPGDKKSREDGTIYYIKHIKTNEGVGKDRLCPVGISRKSLEKDVDFIIECLKDVNNINLPYTTVINGKQINTGISKKQLLGLILPYIDDISQSNEVYSLIRNPQIPSVFYVVQNKNVLFGVDLRDPKSIKDFSANLSKLKIEQDNNILASKIGNIPTRQVFKSVENFFRNNKSGVTELKVSDSLIFRADDFKNGGITGISWYVKNGILLSNYAGLEKPLLSINGIGIINQEIKQEKKTQETESENPRQDSSKQVGFSLDDISIANWGGKKGLQNKRKTQADEKKKLLTKDDIKKHLRPILGDLVDDPQIVNIIDTLSHDPNTKDACVVGKAEVDGITLYSDTFTGVDYHEAFHRIFELFVSKSVRDNIYNKTAKHLGVNLSESTADNNFEGHRQVAEWLADKYMDYRRFNVSTGLVWADRIINLIIDTARLLTHLGKFRMYKLFLEINSGKYANKRNISDSDQERFNKLFGQLNYEIHQTEFLHIANDPMYEDCKNTAFYCILLGLNIDVSGATVQNTLITRDALKRGIDRLKNFGFDLVGTEVEPDQKSAALLAMTEMVVKFDAIADDMAAMMASISTDYRKIMQKEGREDLDGGEASSSYDENFFKWSYEFNKFDKTTSRVKFFFSGLVDLLFADDSHTSFKYATNPMGMPQLIPMNYVFNEVLSQLWDVDTIEEVLYRLSNLAMLDPMYYLILTNLRKVVNGVTNEDGTTNADNEALLAQLMTTIRSNRHTFMLLRAVKNGKGAYNLVLLRSDADYNARVFPILWSQILAKGGSETLKLDEYGRIIFNPKNRDAVDTFSRIARFLTDILQAVSSVNNGVYDIRIPLYVYPEYEYEDSIGNKNVMSAYLEDEVVSDITNPSGCEKVKVALIESFNRIGINVHYEELEYMLTHKYGSSDWTAILQMMLSTDQTDSIGSFIYMLNNVVKNGKLNINDKGEFVVQRGKSVPFDQVFSEIAFVKELGNWKYEYRHAHDQLSVLATGGNRFYEISDNDYMSDVLRNCNKRGKWYEDLKKDPYNYFVGEFDNFGDRRVYGSVTILQLENDPELKIALKHFIGFKTDKRGDEGLDYFEISRREDYLSKIGILENDGMVSLTLSDKKKYCYITGIKLPGIDYNEIRKLNGKYINIDFAKYLVSVPDNVASAVYTIQQREDVVDQFISYAKSEYESIVRNGVRINDGHSEVVNFDTKQQSVKFSSLLGVWETTYDQKTGVPIGEDYISFNDNNKSWEENLAIAEAYFFDRPIEEQRALIGRILSKQTDKQLDALEELGLITRVPGYSKHKSYKNVGLNDVVIKSIKNSYLAANIGLNEQEAESIAVVMYVNDISNKAIMSGLEMERLFSGNPAFYKWTYEEGVLIDRTVDELKRLGGLGSTGINNFTELSNIPLRYKEGVYRCAEVDNEKVSSRQYEQVAKDMYEGMLRQSVIEHNIATEKASENIRHIENLKRIRANRFDIEQDAYELIDEENNRYNIAVYDIEKRVCDDIDGKSIKELEESNPSIAEEVKTKANEVSEALSGDIDVADGGAYITDEMCEVLLRMEGAYGEDIKEAFKILRGEVKSDYLGQIDAYHKVLTSVIGNQKYTAFGRRFKDGNSVPYYHKMALFPVFECIATGKMKNIFDKMKEQQIDMLLVNSAVKVGSEGSKAINWSDFRQDEDPANEDNFKGDIANQDWKPLFKESFHFNTYDCEFEYLRKQLNTDPTEEELLRMGTLMQKIVFSNLMPGRTYNTVDGEQKTGRLLLNRIMDSQNQLSNIGVDKVNKRFFVTNDDGKLLDVDGLVIEDEYDPDGNLIPARNSSKRVLDIEKFSNEVRKMMSDRGADKNIMKALEIVTEASNSEKRLRVPLGAISNSSWLESVLISELNKDIIDVNTPGAFFIQRSIWAMEGVKMYDGKKSVKGDKSARSLYDGKPLKMVNKEGSMDCVLSLDFFRSILPQVESDEYEIDEEQNKAIKEYRESLKKNHPELTEDQIELRIKATGLLEDAYVYKKGPNGSISIDKYGNPVPKKKMRDMTFDEARAWLIKKGIVGENAKASIVAYRIPTQAESSIHALRCVDVLPVVRDTVILPQEFTKITGSDFDIDKLGLSMLNYDKSGNNTYNKGSEKYYQNQLLKDYITLLTDSRSQHILHRSIDNDTKLLKDVLKEIETDSGKQEMPYDFYTLSTQTKRKDDYITGKIGIGPFALNNNNHILTMLYGVKFKQFENSVMTKLGLTDLSGNEDKDGNSIMSWISALINAHVDIAKDPYISRLNVNPFTYNLVNTLIRTGFGKKTFYFTTQPIMKELAIAYNKAGSAYMQDSNKTKWKLLEEAVKETAESWFKDVKINNWSFEDVVSALLDPSNPNYKDTINEYIEKIFDKSLKENANVDIADAKGCTIEIKEKPVKLSAILVQMLMYFAYVLMNPYATSVSNLVKFSKIDTKKHGKSYIELKLYKEGFDDLFYNPDGGGLFEEYGLRKMAEQSYITLKTNNAISMTKAILKDLFLQSTNAFDNAIHVVLNAIGKPTSKSVNLWTTVSNILNASIKSLFINSYAKKLPLYNPTYIRDLITESEDDLKYTWTGKTNRLKIEGTPKYDLLSYIGGAATVKFIKDGETYNHTFNILGYDENSNELIVNYTSKGDTVGDVHIVGGKNTIYDRFMNIYLRLKDDPLYQDVLDQTGEPVNYLLKSLTTGKTFTYTKPVELAYVTKKEAPDTYPNAKFVKLFNALDQNGPESNWIIDGWDQLLHDNKHPKLKRFAEDLVIYAFVTSGDGGGFTKFFKQVPLSWRIESGYADYISEKINEFKTGDISLDQIEDAIVNNWYDDQIVPTYYLNRGDFISYYNNKSTGIPSSRFPTILAALKQEKNGSLTPTISVENAPMYIKVPRRGEENARDSQRRVTVYRRLSYGMQKYDVKDSNGTVVSSEWVHYPIYVKVEPKGNLMRGNFLITEYGREDSTNKEYSPNQEILQGLYKIGDFISESTITEYKNKYGDMFAQFILDMNYGDLLRSRFGGNINNFSESFEDNKKKPETTVSEILKSDSQEEIWNLNNLVGKEIIVGTKDKEGFHEDELVGEIISIRPIKDGYSMRAEIEGREYFINLTPDFKIANENSKFHEIVVMRGDGFINLKDVVSGKNVEYKTIDEAVNGPFNDNPALNEAQNSKDHEACSK